jgi:hypothetical protein
MGLEVTDTCRRSEGRLPATPDQEQGTFAPVIELLHETPAPGRHRLVRFLSISMYKRSG